MFDFSTLTGAYMVALGRYTAVVMSDHDSLLKGWMFCAERLVRTCGDCRSSDSPR